MSRKVRIAQLTCGAEYSGVQKEINDAAESVGAEMFFPDIALADVERAVKVFGLDVRSADLKLMIARGMALVEGKVEADGVFIAAGGKLLLHRADDLRNSSHEDGGPDHHRTQKSASRPRGADRDHDGRRLGVEHD
ncbi:MAG: Uncharacterized protein XD82_0999 [Methanoculleus marisnigri]|uniref:Uncharacterized protein n=1 Tax=Methanoculleus marisnigri TaxID=2198 RepID=A0A101GNF6_9EURY|nr:MAG: Uncharacterized protein XD82_0999 [Methanoculleus marisnigri]